MYSAAVIVGLGAVLGASAFGLSGFGVGGFTAGAFAISFGAGFGNFGGTALTTGEFTGARSMGFGSGITGGISGESPGVGNCTFCVSGASSLARAAFTFAS